MIRAGIDPVYIFGEPHEVKARVASFDGFSGHADRKELGRYVESLTGDITNIYVNCAASSRARTWSSPS